MTRIAPLSILAAVLLASSLHTAAQPPAERSPGTQAYIALVRADQLRDQNDSAAALKAYRDALDLYRGLQTDLPTWNPDIVAYRLTYCENQIRALEPLVASAPAAPSTASGGRESDAFNAAKMESLAQENSYLRQRLEEAEDKLDEAAEQLRGQDDRQQLLDQIARLETENQRLAARQADPAELAQLRNQVAELRSQAEAAQKSAADAAQQNKLAAQESRQALAELGRERQQALARVRTLEDALRREQAASTQLAAERATLQARAKELEALAEQPRDNPKHLAQIAQLEAQLAQAQADAEQVQQLRKAQTEHAATIDRLRTELAQRDERIAQQDQEQDRLNQEIAQRDEAMATLRLEVQAERDARTASEQNAESRIAPLQQEVANLQAELEQARTPRTTFFTMIEAPATPPHAPAESEDKEVGEQKEAVARPTIAQALAHEQAGRFDEALGLYHSLLADDALSLPALKGLARCQFQLEQFKESADTLERAIRINARDLDLHLLQGMAFFRSGDLRRANGILRSLVRKTPDNAHAHNALGAVQMEQNDLRDARRSFEKAIEADASLSDAHYNLAQILWMQDPKDERERAQRHYLQAIELGSAPSERFAKALGLDSGEAP